MNENWCYIHGKETTVKRVNGALMEVCEDCQCEDKRKRGKVLKNGR